MTETEIWKKRYELIFDEYKKSREQVFELMTELIKAKAKLGELGELREFVEKKNRRKWNDSSNNFGSNNFRGGHVWIDYYKEAKKKWTEKRLKKGLSILIGT